MPEKDNKAKKKAWPWHSLGLALVAVALLLLPVDAYSASVSSWVMMALLAGLALCIFMLWRKDSSRGLTKVFMSLAAGAVGVLVVYSCCFNPYWNSVVSRLSVDYTKPMDAQLNADEASEDIEYAFRALTKTHPALLGFVPESLAQAADEAYGAARSADSLTVAELARQIEAMASTLRDAHTGVNIGNLESQKFLRTTALHAQNGDRLVAINGQPLEELSAEKSQLLSADTSAWARLMLENYLASETGLAFLDIPVDDLEYTYENVDGERMTEAVSATDFVPLAELQQITEAESQSSAQDADWVRSEIYPEDSLAVLTLDVCTNTAEYLDCLKQMFSLVREQEIHNVAVDLRQNGGGDSNVATEFIKYLHVESYEQMGLRLRNGPLLIDYPSQQLVNDRHTDLTFDGDIYVLTGPSTFSSAMLFTEYLTDNGLALQVGEAPGNIADGYGEVATFQLPNSGLLLGISTKQFERIDEEAGSLLEPDITVPAEDALKTLRNRLVAQ